MKLAAIAGYAPAQYHLALFYQAGEGTIASYEEAVRWAKRAARQGESKAMLLLANFYRFGAGVEKNLTLAYALVARLANDSPLARALLDELESSISAAHRSKVQKLLTQSKTDGEFLENLQATFG